MRTIRQTLPVLVIGSLALLGCKKETDEERLRKKLDVLPVHLYVGAKATLAEESSEAAVKAARQMLREVVLAGVGVQGKPEARGLSVAELSQLTGNVVLLRSRGAAIVREGRDHRPMLPALLGHERVSPKLTSNLEHALLMMAFVLARFHPSAGLPIPEELILFEASRTDPASLDPRQLGVPARVFKTYVFARNQLCDLALREADAFQRSPGTREDVVALLKMAGSRPLPPGAIDGVSAGFEGLTQGAVALCYFQRDEEKHARRALRSMLEATRRAGLGDHGEVELLQAYLDCAESKGTIAKGEARLAALARRKDLESSVKESVPVLQRYCGTKTAGPRFPLVEKVAFSQMLVGLTLLQAERLGITQELEKSAAYQAVRRFGVTVGRLGDLPASGAARVGQAGQGAARAVWERLRGKGEKASPASAPASAPAKR